MNIIICYKLYIYQQFKHLYCENHQNLDILYHVYLFITVKIAISI